MSEICLEVRDLVKSYQKNIAAVDGLSFTLHKGEILGLIGTNGAGKSTTVSMLATLMKPDTGEILFQGEDLVHHPKKLRSKIGYVPQEIALYESLSGYDNLMFWGRAGHVPACDLKARMQKVAELIGFTEPMLQKKVQEYSGGMKRRLNIGVALLAEPELLILDEPTAGIDIQSRRLILTAIKGLAEQGVAVIYVGHYMEEVEELCDTVCIMNQGKAIYKGSIGDGLQYQNRTFSLEELYEELLMKEALA
ncbi:MAG: ABC transporter ATP-binding protein [Lachnospiraceae bacterium]|nr:ABC transporter ATP-binding protein [Lachnospiraceae bacterium]